MTKDQIIAGYQSFAEMEEQHARDCRALLVRMRAAEQEHAAIMRAVVESDEMARAAVAESRRMLAVLKELPERLDGDRDDADWWKNT